jgi:hypothetical protein
MDINASNPSQKIISTGSVVFLMLFIALVGAIALQWLIVVFAYGLSAWFDPFTNLWLKAHFS